MRARVQPVFLQAVAKDTRSFKKEEFRHAYSLIVKHRIGTDIQRQVSYWLFADF